MFSDSAGNDIHKKICRERHTQNFISFLHWSGAVMLALARANCQCYEVVHCESKSSMEYYLG